MVRALSEVDLKVFLTEKSTLPIRCIPGRRLGALDLDSRSGAYGNDGERVQVLRVCHCFPPAMPALLGDEDRHFSRYLHAALLRSI